MKAKSRDLIVVFLMVFAFVCGVFAITPLTANAAGVDNIVHFSINEPFDVYFETTGSHNNYPVTLNDEKKLTVPIPQLYRTDTLDFVFDGWYIANKQFVGWAVGNVEARPLLQAGDSITINEPTII